MSGHIFRFPAALNSSQVLRGVAAQESGGDAQVGGCPALLEYGLYDDMLWCADCGGLQRFIPLERWPGGWRGLCWGCEREKYVLIGRSESEAA